MFFYVARYENFAVNQKASIFVGYVIREFSHAFSYAYIQLCTHLGSLEGTQEARVVFGYRLVQLLRIFEEEKPAMRWFFEMRTGGESEKMLFDFIFQVTQGFGIPDRCSQLNQQKHSSTRTSTRVTGQA